jgi:transcriptional regulator with XRE-family HTH domain
MDASSNKQSLGQLLLSLRQELGWSARELADRSAVHHSTITLIERGQIAQPRPDKLTRLARALGVEPSDFLTLAGYKPTEELPGFGVYLRATTELPDHAIEELRGHYEYLAARYDVDGRGPGSGEDEEQPSVSDRRRAA